ncbi:MAG: insulinase family protein [Deltaproteobacteria bacterium]|nr:MAG: insulinase family protein [Deltaproteobacteria bacterium]
MHPFSQARLSDRKAVQMLVVVAAAVVVGCGGVSGADALLVSEEARMVDRDARPTQWVHPSGLQVLHFVNGAAPVVAVHLHVGVGSADEQDGEQGMAHLLEHMLFRGTALRPEGDLAREIEAAGGGVNAGASQAETVVHRVVPANEGGRVVALLLDATLHAALEPDALAREKRVIAEEILRSRDLPTRRLTQALFGEVFRSHPYGRPVIGTPEQVASIERDALLRFHRRWYTPSNMTLIVVGGLEREGLQEVLEGIEPPMPAPAARARAERTPEPEQEGARSVLLRLPVEEGHLAMGFRAPPLTHPDAPLVDLLLTHLGQGEASILFDALQRRDRLVTGVYSYLHAPRDHGLALLGASVPVDARGQVPLAEVVSGILRAIAALHRHALSADELARARTMVQSDAIYQRQTVQGIAGRIGQYHGLAGDHRFEERYMERVASATADDLRDAARRWLRPEAMTVAMLVPVHASEPVADEVLAAGLAAFDEALAARPGARVTQVGAVHVYEFPSGLRLLVEPDPSAALFSVRVAGPGGVLHEEVDSAGRDHLLAELLLSGTADRSVGDIARMLDHMAATVSGFAGRHSVGVQATALAEDADRIIGLLAELVYESRLPPAELERVRRETVHRLQSMEDQLASLAFREFESVLFEGHPYSRSPLGTPESLRRIDRQGLQRRLGEAFAPSGLVISVVGAVDPERVAHLVDVHFESRDRQDGASHGQGRTGRTVEGGRSWSPPPGGTVRVMHRDREQVHVVVGFPGPAVGTVEQDALQVLAAMLGGQGGRLFTTLRDELGLVYSVSAQAMGGVDVGAFTVYFATSPGRVDAALDAVRGLLSALGEEGVDSDEVDAARRWMLGRGLIARQRTGARAAHRVSNELIGLGWAWADGMPERLQAVDAEAVRRVAQRWLDPENEVRIVVGPWSSSSPAGSEGAAPADGEE